jgi:hypothetical protein
MNLNYKRNQFCCACPSRLDSLEHSRKIGVNSLTDIRSFFNNISINIGDFICSKCRNKVNNWKKNKNNIDSSTSTSASTTINQHSCKLIILKTALYQFFIRF